MVVWVRSDQKLRLVALPLKAPPMDHHSPKAELVIESGFLDSMGQQVWCVVPHKADQTIEVIILDIWLTAMNLAQQLAAANKRLEELDKNPVATVNKRR